MNQNVQLRGIQIFLNLYKAVLIVFAYVFFERPKSLYQTLYHVIIKKKRKITNLQLYRQIETGRTRTQFSLDGLSSSASSLLHSIKYMYNLIIRYSGV
jgi:hypothetical protein